MAHNLETKIGENGKLEASFVTVKQPAWHGLGTVVPELLTSAEALKQAKMDYSVEKTPCIVNIAGEQITSEDQFAIVRSDKTGADAILGYVGNRYTPLQNVDAFNFFDSIVEDKLAMYETAGVLGKGERIFMSATLPDHFSIEVAKNDLIKPYIFLTNSHDGKGGVVAAITYTRIVCQNTLNVALKNIVGNKVSLRHTKNIHEAMKEAQQLLGITNLYKKEMANLLPLMAKKKATTEQWDAIVASAFASNAQQLKDYLKGERDTKKVSTQLVNTVDAVRMYDNINATQQLNGTKGTIWGAVNAVTGYYQNVETVAKNDNDKFSAILDGRIAKSTQVAFDTAVSFINN
jgi:phage/plasmid-like protein (TIGR03299 family)